MFAKISSMDFCFVLDGEQYVNWMAHIETEGNTLEKSFSSKSKTNKKNAFDNYLPRAFKSMERNHRMIIVNILHFYEKLN